LFISYWAVAFIRTISPEDITRLHTISVDGTALVFVCVITLLTALLFGLLPAWMVSRANLASALRDEGGRRGIAGPERQRSQNILVIGQVALACVLLIGAGLLTRSLLALQNISLGFNRDHVLTANIYLASTKYTEDSKRKVFLDALLDKVHRLPGVTAAGLNDCLPFYNYDLEGLSIVGQPEPDRNHLPWMARQTVSPDYFRVLGIALRRGRLFDERDQSGKENVVIINESIAQRYFAGEAIGLYAVLSYSVSQRTREIGVRIAMGAQSSNILRLITRKGLKIVCIGLMIGVMAALILAHFIGSILYGVSAADPITLGVSVLVLGLAALFACLLPALRATRIDPITALRE
jgi:putative ABC transport system permease protein